MVKIEGRKTYRKFPGNMSLSEELNQEQIRSQSDESGSNESVNKSSELELGDNSEDKNKSSKNNEVWVAALVFVVIGICTAYVCMQCLAWAFKDLFAGQNKVKKPCDFADLQTLYGLTKESAKYLDMLTIGIDDVVEGRFESSLGVFLFIHGGSIEMEKLIEVIAERASRCFDTPTKSVSMPIEEFTDKQALHDHGYIIKRFLDKLEEGRVVKVVNLNEIPAESALALHFICDTYSPPAPNVIILLSLVTNEIKVGPTKGGREKMEKLWQKLHKDELDPLINRLTNIVIPLEKSY